MYILGINAYHAGASACLLADGELVAAAEEERFRRIKYCAGFPTEAIRYCLAEAGIDAYALDHVGISRDPSANLHRKVLFALRRRPSFDLIRDRLANAARVRDPRRALMTALGLDDTGLRAEFHHVEHHRAHMASAFFVSPFRQAAILSVDGMGDFVSTMWGVGRDNCIYIHLTLVPFIGAAGELKTKPTQHSVRDLRSIGIQPDILLCRTDRFLDPEIKRKIALFCDVDEEAVITAKDVSTIYEVPLVLAAEGLDRIVLKYLHLPQTERRMQAWEDLVNRIKNPVDELTIHVVGKYVGYEDSYKSLNEALYHGGFPHRVKVNIKWIEAEALEEPGGDRLLDGADGILVPGGFGNRGTRGMMKAAQVARERGIPYFGICYGFQWATVEYARNVAGLHDADSTEVNAESPAKVIYKLRDLLGVDDLGGTMRLGSYACELAPGSLAQRVYGSNAIAERHRHRYEFNCLYERTLTEHGMRISGRSPDGKFVEIAELPEHPWYLAVQFHPEFKSKPTKAHPLFQGFIHASVQKHESKKKADGVKPYAVQAPRTLLELVEAAA